jgi:hypothetical protein
MHIFHKWSKWQTVRKEVVEHNNGMLVPYHIQEKQCKKCGAIKVKIRNCEISWRFQD